MRACLVTVLLGFAGLCWNISPAQSQPLRTALIISNAQYANLPPLARCTASAAAARDALKARGFEVVERSDVRRGEFDAAIGALAKRTTASPPSVAVVYYCGYAQEFNGRSFLLPAAADVKRENDVLTQGLISKSLVDSLARVGDSSGVVLLDGFQPPGAPATGFARLGEQIQPGSFAVIGVNNDAAAQGPTAAAQALRGQLAGDEVSLEKFVGGMRAELAKGAAGTAFFVAATGRPSFLVGGKPPPTPVAAAPPPAPAPTPPPAASAPPAAAAPAAPQQAMVDEDRMSDQDRRQVQLVLATLGYYSGRIDATFGPETRAAIRRYQFEIKAEMTGRLTAEQATKLVNTVR
ncbi:Caspase domain-containing protein [Rhodospirillales bacterium URHD0017]|nr:Caspase domain-containing protein [Rhodospirillales bacterium URHD0017]